MPTIAAEKLEALGEAVFVAAGAGLAEAERTAASLVAANLVGCDTHGVIRIPQYLDMIRDGLVATKAAVEVVRETAATAVIDGHWGFGQVTAATAMRLAIQKARATGLGAVGTRRCNHVGRVGEYPMFAAAAGMVGLATVNSAHGGVVRMAPFGGTQGRVGLNVLSVALPRSEGPPFLLDMTCSVIPEGKVRLLRNKGEPLPPDAAIDGEGRSTRDPAAVYGPPLGALLPLGGAAGHKGFGLALVCDILSGALGGAGTAGTDAQHPGNGAFFLALDLSQMRDPEAFARDVAALAAHVKDCPRAAGVEEIFIPGEIEARIEERRRREGIPVDEETWRQIAAAASTFPAAKAIVEQIAAAGR